LLACAVCGGTVDDLVMVLGSSVGLTGLALGFDVAFQKASRIFGWQFAADLREDVADGNATDESSFSTTESVSDSR
jgi:hypothetical protein